jgi:peptidyl-prolyl cis-trans isomerase A (cyclophilin A)
MNGRIRRRTLLAWPALAGLSAFAQPAAVRTRVETPLGEFIIEVDPRVAPVTVANFLRYVDGGYLDRAQVYRIVTLANQPPETRHKIEVVQWGLNLQDDRDAPFPPIAHETTQQTGLRHLDGTVSMARSTPGTAGSEFFICVGAQPELDFGGGRNPDGQGFAAFGRVAQGMDVVRALHGQAQAKQFIEPAIPIRRVRRMPSP